MCSEDSVVFIIQTYCLVPFIPRPRCQYFVPGGNGLTAPPSFHSICVVGAPVGIMGISRSSPGRSCMENSKFGEIGCSLRNTCSEGRAILGHQGPRKRTGATYVPPEYQQDPLTSRIKSRFPFLVFPKVLRSRRPRLSQPSSKSWVYCL